MRHQEPVKPMANAVGIQRKATEIADVALREQRTGAARTALIEQGMADLMAAGREAQQQRNGRELAIFEHDFDRIAIFIDALVDGNYRETAAQLAGLAESGVRAWIKRADDGEERYKPIACLIRLAEAIAEADALATSEKRAATRGTGVRQ